MTRKWLTLVFTVFIMVIVVSAVLASNGTQIGIVGARSTAMGSCFRGLADDWSSLFFNPAGLTQLSSEWTIGGSFGLMGQCGSYTQYSYPSIPVATPPVFAFSGMITNRRDVARKNFYIPSVGIFYKLNKSIILGLGVYTPFSLRSEWDLMTLPETYGNASSISKEKETYSDHRVTAIQPTVAFRLTERLSLGLGASILTGNLTLNTVQLPTNPAAVNWTYLQTMAAALDINLSALTMDQHRIAVENHMEGTGLAFGFNCGLHYTLSKKFSFGFSARYYTDLRLKGTLDQTQMMHGDEIKVIAIMGLPTQLFADANDLTGETNQTALAGLFGGQNIGETYDKIEVNLPLPMTIGGGLAFKPSPRLTLTADVSWTHWATWDFIGITVEGGDNIVLRKAWTNTIETGIGFEWMVLSEGITQFYWRGGFYTVDTPGPEETMNPTILDPNRRFVFTQGLGLKLGKICLNLAYEYVFFQEREVETYIFDSGTGMADNYAGLYHSKTQVFTLGTTVEL